MHGATIKIINEAFDVQRCHILADVRPQLTAAET
jgi:hypothetical protein